MACGCPNRACPVIAAGADPLELRPLPQGFGAEVRGFDVADGRSPEDVAALRSAFDRHHLLILRDCAAIPPERQVELIGWLGPVTREGIEPDKPWSFMDNANAVGRAELKFHCDNTYLPHALEGISLLALAVPDAPTSTTFASNARGWQALPEGRREMLRGRRARHFFGEGNLLGLDWPRLEHWHPACLIHPRTGEELLFLTEHHACEIEGLNAAEGRALLAEAFAVLYAPQALYEHVWQAGDLVIWDNLAVQHARTREADPAAGRRLLRRVSIGPGFSEQLAALKTAGG